MVAEKPGPDLYNGRSAPQVRIVGGAFLIALLLFGCASPPAAVTEEPPAPILQPVQNRIGGSAMVLVLQDEMIERRVRDQQQAVESARALRDVRLYQLYDDPGLRQKLHKILYLHGRRGTGLEDPAALFQTWQDARFEIGTDPLQIDLPTFVAQASKQSRDLAAALERTNVFDEVKVVEAYAPGFQRVAFGESQFDYMIWQVPDYATRSIRWHMISRKALDKREVFSNPLTAGPNEIYLQTWLDTLGEKAQALQP